MSVNFKLVENAPPKIEEKYEEFIELYNNSDLSVQDIRERLDWTAKNIQDARVKALSEGRIEARGNSTKNYMEKDIYFPKYYYCHPYSKRYIVSKVINGKKVYFGSYKKENIAMEIVEKLKSTGWDKTLLPQFKKELGVL